MSALEVGMEIRAARVRARMSQNALASALGWHQTQVSRIEAGKSELRWEDGLAISKILGAPTMPAEDADVLHDARAYRRILEAIGARESEVRG